MESKEITRYPAHEELANSVTHGIGIVFSLAALTLLVVHANMQDEFWKILSFSIYGGSLLILYTASTLYHSFTSKRIKHYLKIIDHSAIYLVIAGTYTPFLLVLVRNTGGWSLFTTIWAVAIAGIIFKLFYVNRFKLASTIIYLLMGWLAAIAFWPLFDYLPEGGFEWLLAGGICYSFGVIFYLWKQMPFHHAVWHLFVLGGSVCHFFSIFFHILPA